MPKYRVRPGRAFGAKRVPPGGIVTMSEAEAAPFLDRLEPVSSEKKADPDEAIPESATAPGGGFEPGQATVEQVKTWLRGEPGRMQAAVALQAERDGKNRPSAIEALEAYIATGD